MVIKDINIEGFGKFFNHSLKDLYKGINIINGQNEAGKSTLLYFLRYTFFGHPSGNTRLNRYKPLWGGNHGGRIKVLMNSGEEVIFERFAGSKGGNKKLYTGNQVYHDDFHWFQYLQGVNAEIYKKVYSFSLDELVSLSSLKESGIQDRIFSAGYGLGNISIRDIEEKLSEYQFQFYKKGGKRDNYVIPSVVNEIQHSRSKQGKIQNNIERYQSLKQELENLKNETVKLENEKVELYRKKNILENYLKSYYDFIDYVNAEKALNDRLVWELPENSIGQLEKLENKEEFLNQTIHDLRSGNHQEEGLEELERRYSGIFINHELEGESQNIEYLRNNLNNYKSILAEKEKEEKQILDYDQKIDHKIQHINSSLSREDIMAFQNLHNLKDKLFQYKKDSQALEEKKKELKINIENQENNQSSFNPKNLSIGGALIMFIISVTFFVQENIVWGGTFVLISLLFLTGRKFIEKNSNIQQLKNNLQQINEREQKLNDSIKHFCRDSLKCSGSLSFEGIKEYLETLESLQVLFVEQSNIKKKIDEERLPFLEEFEACANRTGGKIFPGKAFQKLDKQVEEIIRTYDLEKQKIQDKKYLEDTINNKKRALENNRRELEKVNETINELLEKVNASDREEFRRKIKENEETKSLLEKKNKAWKSIEKIAGYNKAKDVIEYFRNHELWEIEEKLENINQTIKDKEEKYQDKNVQRGQLERELEQIEGESELNDLLTYIEGQREKLHDARKKWLSARIARSILDEVKERYEREKQPEVIQKANYYFKEITNGQYIGMRISFEENEVRVYDEKENYKSIEQLSRGTKEQLLISLRLGFIEEYEKMAEPMPVIADEVLVNFDPWRATNMARVLHEFAKNRQLLLFTCHDYTQDLFNEKDMDINIVNL